MRRFLDQDTSKEAEACRRAQPWLPQRGCNLWRDKPAAILQRDGICISNRVLLHVRLGHKKFDSEREGCGCISPLER